MNIKRIIFYAVLALAGLGLFTGGFVLAQGWRGLAPPSLAAAGGVVGEWGPVGLVFAQPMKTQTVETAWRIDPVIKGNFRWGGNTLWFYPSQALAAGTEYRIVLTAGFQSSGGKTSEKDESWTVKVRAPEIAYLSPAGDTSDLWVKPADDGAARQLTQGETTYDFGVSYDGTQVAYSAMNAEKGFDIWIVDRDGKNPRKVVDCGRGRCINPAWSSDGATLAYSQYAPGGENLNSTPFAYSQNGAANASPTGTGASTGAGVPTGTGSLSGTGAPTGMGAPIGMGAPRIWTLDLATGKTMPLYSDPQISGSSPVWSPDGHKIAFIDEGGVGVRVKDQQTGSDTLLNANTAVIGAWSPDSSSLTYADLDSSDMPSFGAAFEVTFPGGHNLLLFDNGPANADYSVPVASPDGNWIAVGLRYVEGPPGRQLWLLNQDGSQQKVVSGDNLVTHADYSWRPDSGALVFQQFSLGSSSATPDVVVWDLKGGTFQTIASNATHPQWLP